MNGAFVIYDKNFIAAAISLTPFLYVNKRQRLIRDNDVAEVFENLLNVTISLIAAFFCRNLVSGHSTKHWAFSVGLFVSRFNDAKKKTDRVLTDEFLCDFRLFG